MRLSFSLDYWSLTSFTSLLGAPAVVEYALVRDSTRCRGISLSHVGFTDGTETTDGLRIVGVVIVNTLTLECSVKLVTY